MNFEYVPLKGGFRILGDGEELVYDMNKKMKISKKVYDHVIAIHSFVSYVLAARISDPEVLPSVISLERFLASNPLVSGATSS